MAQRLLTKHCVRQAAEPDAKPAPLPTADDDAVVAIVRIAVDLNGNDGSRTTIKHKWTQQRERRFDGKECKTCYSLIYGDSCLEHAT